MARIPDEVLAQVKRIDLKALVESSGVTLRRRGKEWVGLCPLHEEETPSLCVNPEKGSWHCFGCDKGGSVIDFAMAREGVGFRRAVERLVAEHLPGVELEPAPSGPCPISPDVDAAERLGQVSAFYEEALHGDDARGREYLESRGILDEELARRFRLGFANRTLGPLLLPKATAEGARLREALQEIGILRESGHEHLNGRVTVLLSDLEGQPVQMYGRSVTPNLRAGTPKHLYLAGTRSSCVFNLAAVREHRELVLCEAIFDALTFLRHGFANVTTGFGKNGATPALMEAMERFGTKRVLIAYDHDQPGDEAARTLAERLLAVGIEPYRVLFPRGMDANEYARKVTPAAKSLELVLRKAERMGTARVSLPVAGDRSAEADGSREMGAGGDETEAAEERAALSSAASSAPSPETPPTPPAGGTAPQERRETGDGPRATSLPVVPKIDVPAVVKEHEVVITLGDRRYRVRGLDRNLSYGSLKVNVLAARGEGFHVDTLDLYSARQRGVFLKQAAIELGAEEDLVKRDLAKVFLKLEELQEEQIGRALEPQVQIVTLSAEEQEEALTLLRDPSLVDRVLEDLERCGLVGERTNKLVAYLAAVSRQLARPLAVMVQSSSAAGKSALMEGVLAFIPQEERVQYSAMTGQSLFYMGEKDLQHKVLAIAEEEGAERASYALKLLQSEGELSIAATGKDPTSGRLVTHEYHVEGPVAILLTTTAIDLDEELLNRCVVLTVDEGREQTRAIHRMQRQRETLEGQLQLLGRDRLRTLHQNAQRLLRPLVVVNPYASALGFPDSCTRTRRDHEKYLMLIRAIALLHQHQRQVKEKDEAGERVPYVEVTLGDLELANRLAHEVLGRTLDELPPQTRRLLLRIEELVTAECEELGSDRAGFGFTRRWLREKTGLGDTQLKVHLERLVDMEYLVAHRQGHAQRHVYELLYDGGGKNGEPFLPGLIDVSTFGRADNGPEYDGNRSGSKPNRSGQNGNRSASGRPLVGGWSGGGRIDRSRGERETSLQESELSAENGLLGGTSRGSSYVVSRRTRSQREPGTQRGKL
jgi:DNA primase catalytic core